MATKIYFQVKADFTLETGKGWLPLVKDELITAAEFKKRIGKYAPSPFQAFLKRNFRMVTADTRDTYKAGLANVRFLRSYAKNCVISSEIK